MQKFWQLHETPYNDLGMDNIIVITDINYNLKKEKKHLNSEPTVFKLANCLSMDYSWAGLAQDLPVPEAAWQRPSFSAAA